MRARGTAPMTSRCRSCTPSRCLGPSSYAERCTWTVSCVPPTPCKWAKLHSWYQLQSRSSGLNEMKLQRAQPWQRWMQRVALFIDHEPMELVAQSLSDRVTPQYPREIRGNSPVRGSSPACCPLARCCPLACRALATATHARSRATLSRGWSMYDSLWNSLFTTARFQRCHRLLRNRNSQV